MELLSNTICFDGEQRIYQIQSNYLKGASKVAVYMPPQALKGQKCAALFYLAGLTCTEETFIIKAHAQRLASQLGLILIAPEDRKSTRLNSSHSQQSRMPSSA